MTTQSNGYSSTVRGWLVVGEHRLPLAQVGPDHCIVRESIDTNATNAELIIEVDRDQHRRKVVLPEGISVNSNLVRIASHELPAAPPGEIKAF